MKRFAIVLALIPVISQAGDLAGAWRCAAGFASTERKASFDVTISLAADGGLTLASNSLNETYPGQPHRDDVRLVWEISRKGDVLRQISFTPMEEGKFRMEWGSRGADKLWRTDGQAVCQRASLFHLL